MTPNEQLNTQQPHTAPAQYTPPVAPAPTTRPAVTVELWPGYTVEVNTQLMDDFDFSVDMAEAVRTEDLKMMITMYMALIGGEETFETIKQHIIQVHGYVSQKELMNIVGKVNDALPKGGNRAQRRSWKSLS